MNLTGPVGLPAPAAAEAPPAGGSKEDKRGNKQRQGETPKDRTESTALILLLNCPLNSPSNTWSRKSGLYKQELNTYTSNEHLCK